MKTLSDIVFYIALIMIGYWVFEAIKTSYDKKHKPEIDTLESYNSVSYMSESEPFELSDTLNQLHLPNQLNEEFFNGQNLYLSTDNYDLTVDFKSGNAIINFTKENTLK